jgi:quinol monooxygenase YgiN
VGAVYDRAFFLESTKYARSQTAPTVGEVPTESMLLMLAMMMTILDPNAVYVATYVDVQVTSTNDGAALIKAYREATRAEKGNLGVDVVRETGRPSRSVIMEIWNDAPSFEAHEKAPHTIEFRAKLRALQNSPYDQRVHKGISVDPKPWKLERGTVSVVTHVDVPPPSKDQAAALLQHLAEASRSDEGNLRYDAFQELSRTNHFTVFAVWKDRKTFDSHETKTHSRQFREAIAPMLGAPYDERLYTSE